MKHITLSQSNHEKIINQTLQTLSNDGLVVFPSDTVYGLLVDAKSKKAVQKLISFKDRPVGKAISVFISGLEMMSDLCFVPVNKRALLEKKLPGKFTIVLDSKGAVNRLLESEKGTLGVRWIDHELVNRLVTSYGKPVTATSANLGGQTPHYSINAFLKQLPEKKKGLIDLIVDAGQLPRNKPSTVIDFTTDELSVFRKGDDSITDTNGYISQSEEKTQEHAKGIIEDLIHNNSGKPIVIILQGDLGAGKTQYVKGVASYLEIDSVVSPTFVVHYEYPILGHRDYSVFNHYDLYNVTEKQELDTLQFIPTVLQPHSISCIEWGEKIDTDILNDITQSAHVVIISLDTKSKNERMIGVQTLT